MKNYILLILLCLSFSLNGQTIPVENFYMPGATWTEAVKIVTSSSSHSGSSGADGKEFKIERDTMVSGKNYHIISKRELGGYRYSYDYSGTSFGINPPSSTHFEFGRIRVEDNRVYFTQDHLLEPYGPSIFDLGVEYLLYDFNLSVGSSVPDALDATNPGILVGSIDTIELSPGIYRALYHDSLRKNLYWINSIGSSRGFFSGYIKIAFYPWGYNGTIGLCYNNPSLGISYHFPFTDSELLGNLQRDCFNVGKLAVSDEMAKGNELAVYPNPATEDFFHVDGLHLETVAQVVVSDITGKTLLRLEHPFSSGKTQVHVPIKSGLYFVRFEFADGSVATRRLCKL